MHFLLFIRYTEFSSTVPVSSFMHFSLSNLLFYPGTPCAFLHSLSYTEYRFTCFIRHAYSAFHPLYRVLIHHTCFFSRADSLPPSYWWRQSTVELSSYKASYFSPSSIMQPPPPPVPQSCRSLPNRRRRWPFPSSLFFLSHAESHLSPLDDVRRRKFWKGDRPSSFHFLFQAEFPPPPLMTSEWDPAADP